MIPTLIFDLDETLVECSMYYREAIEALVAATTARTHLPAKTVRTLFEQIDLAALPPQGMWIRERFPRSFRAASIAADIIQGIPPNNDAGDAAYKMGASVFTASYPLLPHVTHVLDTYASRGWQLVLWTKGDPQDQRRKLLINNLDRLFPMHVQHVVPAKTVARLQGITELHQADPERTWVIGDSNRDDIGPALAAGLGTVQIRGDHWAYDNTEHLPLATLDRVADLATVIPLDPTDYFARHAVPRERVGAVVA